MLAIVRLSKIVYCFDALLMLFLQSSDLMATIWLHVDSGTKFLKTIQHLERKGFLICYLVTLTGGMVITKSDLTDS